MFRRLDQGNLKMIAIWQLAERRHYRHAARAAANYYNVCFVVLHEFSATQVFDHNPTAC